MRGRCANCYVVDSAYDAPSARLAEESGVDIVFVGDSAANNVLGYPDTTPISMDEMVMLARAARRTTKHAFFLVDMHLPGVEVRPLRQMTGGSEFDEVFLEEVRLPADALLGPLHGGWNVAMATLTNERGHIGSAGISLARRLDAIAGMGGVDGPVDADRVATLTERLLACDVYEVAISDTIGVAHPGDICRVLDVVLARVPVEQIALHLHDTRGTALANVLTALSYGVFTFDASAGGLGGCPFAPGAAGNVGTEDLLYTLHGLGIDTHVSLDRMTAATRFISRVLNRAPRSRYAQAVAG